MFIMESWKMLRHKREKPINITTPRNCFLTFQCNFPNIFIYIERSVSNCTDILKLAVCTLKLKCNKISSTS